MIAARRPDEYEVIGVRRFHELRAGDMFRATLADIRPGEIIIKFNDGKTHTARSFVLPDARIGEESVFLVRENDMEGRIVLEMVRLAEETKQDNLLREIMLHAGLAGTPAVYELGRMMLAAGIPVDVAALQNPVLQRLVHCPAALLHATPEEAKEVTRYINRNSRYRTYHRVNRCTELHIFNKPAETTTILTTVTAALGRIEVTIKQKTGYPTTCTYRTDNAQTRKLLTNMILPANVAPSANISSPINITPLINATPSVGASPLTSTVSLFDIASLDTPFTLLTPPPAGFFDAPELTPKRFNFDMRV